MAVELDLLARSVAEGIDPGLSREGILQLLLTQSPETEVEAWYLSVIDGKVRYGPGVHPNRTAQMVVRNGDLERLRRGALSLRDPQVTALLGLKGDLAFMHELVTACSRPDTRTIEDFARAESHSQSRKVELARATGISRERFARVLAERVPCVISGALGWNAIEWTLGDLRDRYGHLPFRPGPDGGERLEHLVDRMLRGDVVYSCGCAVPDGMRNEFRFPFLEERELAPMQLWIGSASNDPVTPLHRDARPVLLAQVLGRKKLLVYPPHAAKQLYPRRAHDKYYQPCWVDVSYPDLERFPRFADATPLEIVLHPGEILHLPIGWFHCVYALDPVVSVSTIIVRDTEWDWVINAC
ncbi:MULTISPECIES: cupin-like domain-containing protein [unclassified Cupriavidus]|uniref:cupin-like domain-containing protein n=1 Tax=unclassified Cupriavidus TaxID=2640874 RepID=UPI00313DA025